MSPNGFRTVQEIDLQGTFNTFKATIDEVKRNHGVYTHISATLHYTAIPWQAAASSAKAGIDALSQSIAVEYGPFGVRSNVIAPGMISGTEGADRLTPKGAGSLIESRIPQQRQGVIVSLSLVQPSVFININLLPPTQDDIANMGVFLFSDAAAYCSGAKFVSGRLSPVTPPRRMPTSSFTCRSSTVQPSTSRAHGCHTPTRS